jgi:hypothetical protein
MTAQVMNDAPMQRRKPPQRAFSGLVGKPYEPSVPEAIPAPGPVLVPALTPAKKPGRPPKYANNGEKQAEYRKRQKIKEDDTERRTLVTELMRIYKRQQGDIVFNPLNPSAKDHHRISDGKQRRAYHDALMEFPLKDLQLALATEKEAPDSHGRLPGETSGEGPRSNGMSSVERQIAAAERDQDGRKVRPKGAGPDSFEHLNTADPADNEAPRGQRISAKELENEDRINAKFKALALKGFDEYGHCQIPSMCAYDQTPCTFKAASSEAAIEHLWTEFRRGEKLWEHFERLRDPDIAEMVGPLLTEARRKACANTHYWVITQWLKTRAKSRAKVKPNIVTNKPKPAIPRTVSEIAA